MKFSEYLNMKLTMDQLADAGSTAALFLMTDIRPRTPQEALENMCSLLGTFALAIIIGFNLHQVNPRDPAGNICTIDDVIDADLDDDDNDDRWEADPRNNREA